MKYISVSLLLLFFITGCSHKKNCDEKDYQIFKVNFPSQFPFGRHKHLDSLELNIGGKIISYNNPDEEICLSTSHQPDTIFYRYRSTQQYSFVLAKFKSGETYSIAYNDCEGEFQLNTKASTDLTVEYRIKINHLTQGDTLEIVSIYGDNVFVTDSTVSEWIKVSFSANCYNSFKYLVINKVQGVKRKCDEYDSTLCDWEADSVLHLKQITFQQLHNEKLDIEYDYRTKEITIKIQ